MITSESLKARPLSLRAVKLLGKKYELSISFLICICLYCLGDLTSHLVECKVPPIGTKFVSQKLPRKGPVVDHRIPDHVDGIIMSMRMMMMRMTKTASKDQEGPLRISVRKQCVSTSVPPT